MATLLEKIAEAHGTGEFEQVFAELYPQCESISVDYAVLEPRSRKKEPRLYCLPAEFGWNDLGSWAALHEHKSESGATDADTNVLDAANALTLESQGNYVFAPGRTVALVGVKDLVVVDTGDALLITTREQSQNVGKVVKMLEESGKDELI
jgi:mannose-1-phosphate guanylyltransferase